MKNLSVLLTLKKEKHEHVMLGENGTYTGMTTGSKGIVKSTDEAISQELFGEYPLSESNASNFKLLSKLKLPKVKKPIDQNAPKNPSTSEQKPKIGKAA
ncbi:MAG: hypothetical protein OJF59_000614 [Cytophagales bacterium]|jgi:hypothetical protein|nr:MAG: hypothetical protein OJF59_000614 [Cytophagales bacterium]